MTSKILHIADLHLGLPDVIWEEKNWSRQNEQKQSCNQAVQYCIKNKIETFIIGVDIFNSSKPSSYFIEQFYEIINPLLENGIGVIIIPGNHDIGVEQNLLRALGKPKIENLKIITANQVFIGMKYNLICIPFREGINYKKEVKGLLKFNDKNKFTIVVLHDEYSGGLVGSENYIMKGKVNIIKELPKVDLVLAGHLHKQQILKKFVIYPGSNTTIGFGEEKDKKGFVEVTITDKKLSYDIHQFKNLMNWQTINVDFTKIEKQEKIKEGSLIRIKFKMTSKKYKGFSVKEFIKDIEKKNNCKVLKTEFEIINKNKKTQKIKKKSNPIELFGDYLKQKKYKTTDIKSCQKELNKILKVI